MQATIISTLPLSDLKPTSQAVATISNVQHLASYNWIETPEPTIAVPGCPKRWTPPWRPGQYEIKVPKDPAEDSHSENAARHPASPMEPLFRALYLLQPDLDIRCVDLVTDRSNIRKLFSVINPNLDKRALATLTIHIERQGKTALLCCEEASTRERIPRTRFRGYGQEFEKATTTSCVAGSTSHYRVTSYDLGGLSCIVRYEADGYVEPRGGHDLSATLSTMLVSLNISDFPTPIPRHSSLSTSAPGRKVEMDKVLPQMWVSQTSLLVCGSYDKKDLFRECWLRHVGRELKEWEKNHQVDLKRLAALLKWIIASVPRSGQKATLDYDSRREELVISRAERPNMLPTDLYDKWEGQNQGVVMRGS
ncbi:uncharacterized protein BO72DRAFT_470272 [Aspergillus fijiensis CBS 313.89]|uniref:Geranylgeranyl pyrophosphate synthetase n=1 Tax=Aspergillus fijiensis CBS 313.89 TaxID=1448319 RepID=A0A8G1RJN1_9EURO|nr:uncharacterized protein BO72DRAFT_470272 [Aspergillus fijiensis CBS 313.89]RAK75232.1 hypothetical protein BO72DRAFT_470272 [Aspergillus fijiensis CBS 313.89]